MGIDKNTKYTHAHTPRRSTLLFSQYRWACKSISFWGYSMCRYLSALMLSTKYKRIFISNQIQLTTLWIITIDHSIRISKIGNWNRFIELVFIRLPILWQWSQNSVCFGDCLNFRLDTFNHNQHYLQTHGQWATGNGQYKP